jgi:hypothetical protein
MDGVDACLKHEPDHEGVLRLMSDGEERARPYKCCWGCRTNCNATHVNIYTEAIHGRKAA